MNNSKLFFIDEFKNVKISYKFLLSIINSRESTIANFIKKENVEDVFIEIMKSIHSNKEITLFDSDFTSNELQKLLNSDFEFNEEKLQYNIEYSNWTEFIKTWSDRNEWKINIYTSGTTGLPKRVSHSFQSLTKSVRVGPKYADNIWGFAFNPTHIAGLNVFFQAVLNSNTIVYLFNRDRQYIYSQIEKYRITHLSSTPTFYRLLLPFERSFDFVRQITFGGEKFDSFVVEELKKIFPNAKFTNIYASTEIGSLLTSSNDSFAINKNLQHLVKIQNNELLVHSTIMGKSESLILVDDWYHTNDIIEIVQDNPLRFRFQYRNDELINVGGYKVNPHEVEEEILKIDNIIEARVFSKKSSLIGNLLCCEIVSLNGDLSERIIREFLETRLQNFKIPRIIKFTDKIEKTRTGKKNRS
jgi:acyl-coenzyme A synthetase/AMP-(fatty) acid ligase